MQAEAEAKVVTENEHGLLRETFDLQGRLRRSPYAMVAGAVGIGFVLGGGVFTRLTGKILETGLRVALMAALPLVRREVAEVLSGPKLKPNKETDQ